MTAYARRISHDELSHSLHIVALQHIRNDVTEAVAEWVEDPGNAPATIPQGVEFWYADGELVALAQADHIEAGVDHSGNGTLLAEFEVGSAFQRCVTCGEKSTSTSAWCGRRCRRLLRDMVNRDLDEAEKWAVCQRNSRIGWHGPLTRDIAEALYWRG